MLSKKLNCILLIDDDQVTTYLHHIILQEAQVADSLEVKHNGKDALEFIKTLSQSGFCPKKLFSQLPDLIFLDVKMPVMDGFGFLRKLNDFYEGKGENRPMRVIMLSSSVNPKDLLMASELGCDEYLQKPLTIDKVCSVMGSFFPSHLPGHKKREGTNEVEL